MAVLTSKMKSGQRKIQSVFEKFEVMISDLNTGVNALVEHKRKNEEVILEKTGEIAEINADMVRAEALVKGLQALTNG